MYDHHIWSYMITLYDHHVWSSYMIIIYDHHMWWSYMIIIYDNQIWWSYMMTVWWYHMIKKKKTSKSADPSWRRACWSTVNQSNIFHQLASNQHPPPRFNPGLQPRGLQVWASDVLGPTAGALGTLTFSPARSLPAGQVCSLEDSRSEHLMF